LHYGAFVLSADSDERVECAPDACVCVIFSRFVLAAPAVRLWCTAFIRVYDKSFNAVAPPRSAALFVAQAARGRKRTFSHHSSLAFLVNRLYAQLRNCALDLNFVCNLSIIVRELNNYGNSWVDALFILFLLTQPSRMETRRQSC
jgi:hypothetical protein